MTLLTPPHPTICTRFQHPPVLFSPSPSKWALSLPTQEELRSFNTVLEGQLLPFPLYIYI
jgi:hypothetical protein